MSDRNRNSASKMEYAVTKDFLDVTATRNGSDYCKDNIHAKLESRQDSRPSKSIMKNNITFPDATVSSHKLARTFSDENLDHNNNLEKLQSLKSVTFSAIQIRTYPLVIGDHPCCTTGLPVSIGWNYTKEEVLEVEEYESNRPPRSPLFSLRMDQSTRRELLTEVSDIQDVKRAERKIFRERESCGKTRSIASCDFFGARTITVLQE